MLYNPANRLLPGSGASAQLPQNIQLPTRRRAEAPLAQQGVRRIEANSIPSMLSKQPEGYLARMMRDYGISK